MYLVLRVNLELAQSFPGVEEQYLVFLMNRYRQPHADSDVKTVALGTA